MGPITYYPLWDRSFASRSIFDDGYYRDISSTWRTALFLVKAISS